jgi:hypothetical protein
MRATFASLLVILLIFGSALPFVVQFSHAQASTEISGPINSNMTLTKTGGPYLLTGPVTVSNGVTLTVQAGTSILLGSNYLLVNGTLTAAGTVADPIRIQGGTSQFDSQGNPIYPITFTPFSVGWTEQTRTGCIIENAVLTNTSIYMRASPKINNSTFTNSFVSVANYTLTAEPMTPSPTIVNNTMNGQGTSVAILTVNSIGLIANNNISGYTTGIQMTSDAGTTVQTNLISANTYGIQLIAQKGPVLATIKNNTVTNNTVGISILRGSAAATSSTIQYNNIYANTNYSLTSVIPDNVNVSLNWWGTTDTAAINQTIYDHKQNSTFGTVAFVPFLNAANPAAPNPSTPVIPEMPAPSVIVAVFVVALGAFASVKLARFCKKRD